MARNQYVFEFPDGQHEQAERERAERTIFDLIGSIVRVGGMFTVAVDRREVAPGEFDTFRLVVAYDSFAPAQHQRRDPEPDLVAEQPAEPEGEEPDGVG